MSVDSFCHLWESASEDIKNRLGVGQIGTQEVGFADLQLVEGVVAGRYREGFRANGSAAGDVGWRISNHPHLFRHSSATYYATRLNRAVFCYRYGWSYRSNMADRYIDREALNDQESVRAVRANTMDDLRRENDTLKEDVAHLRNQLNQIHQMMNALTADPKVTKTLAEQVKKTGQGERLKELQANLS